jgi:hypothetical protein
VGWLDRFEDWPPYRRVWERLWGRPLTHVLRGRLGRWPGFHLYGALMWGAGFGTCLWAAGGWAAPGALAAGLIIGLGVLAAGLVGGHLWV